MVLIGALAFGLVAHKPIPLVTRWDFWPKAILLPCAACWTVALFLLHLRQPRPSLTRMSRRPGWVACLAGTCGVLIGLLDRLTRLTLVFGKQGFDSTRFLTLYGFPNWRSVLRDYIYSLDFIEAHYIAMAVAGAWVALAVGGRWQAQTDWLDRTGRATGLFWLVSMPVLWVVQDWMTLR